MAKNRREDPSESLKKLAKKDPKRLLLLLLLLVIGWGAARLTGHDVSLEEVLSVLLGQEQPASQVDSQPQVGDILDGTVTRVVDGDTIIVKVDGSDRRVRLLGVDTPETVHPNKEVQFYGPEASAFTKGELTGKRVWLEYDVAPLDRYQRHLAYVWLQKPAAGEAAIRRGMFNARLLLEGYAKVMTIQPNSRHADLFVKFQEEARKARRGLWQREP